MKMSSQTEVKCKCHHAKLAAKKTNEQKAHSIHAFDHVLPKRVLTPEDNESVELFKEFLQIRSITSEGPNGKWNNSFLLDRCQRISSS